MNVLILSAGRRVSLVRGFMAAAHKRGVQVLCADIDPARSAACNISDAAFSLPHVQSGEYKDALLYLCKQHNIGVVVPTIDTELPKLSQTRADFESDGISIVVSDHTIVRVCNDKRQTAPFFEKYNLQSPQIYQKTAITYPAFSKPFDGSLSKDTSILFNKSDLTDKITQDDRFMISEYLSSDQYIEYTCDLYFSINGFLKCLVPRRRLEVRGGEVSKALTEDRPCFRELGKKLSYLPGARGCLTVQVMMNRESGLLKLLEINPRFGGGYPLSRLAGALFEDWIVSEYIFKESISFFDDWRRQLMMLRFDGEILVENYVAG